jgi:hypothetical protein
MWLIHAAHPLPHNPIVSKLRRRGRKLWEQAMTTETGLRCSIRSLLTAACLAATTTVAAAAESKESSLACARRDLQLVTMIEAHGQAQTVAPQSLADAFFTVMRARVACDQGRISEAIALYDGIAFAPILARTRQ